MSKTELKDSNSQKQYKEEIENHKPKKPTYQMYLEKIGCFTPLAYKLLKAQKG